MVNDPYTQADLPPHEQPLGVCMSPAWSAKPGSPSLWETAESETWVTRVSRFEKARQLCLECPALAACQAYADDMERQGWAIDGVVAGRVPPEPGRRRCHRCHRYFIPTSSSARSNDLAAREYRRGLCRNCYRIEIEVESPKPRSRRAGKRKGR